jgi:hypothetical protein
MAYNEGNTDRTASLPCVGVSAGGLLHSLIRPLAPNIIRNGLPNDEVKLDALVVMILLPPIQKIYS